MRRTRRTAILCVASILVGVVAHGTFWRHTLQVLSARAEEPPPASEPPLVVLFQGFNELPVTDLATCFGSNPPQNSHCTAERIRRAVGGVFPSENPYRTVNAVDAGTEQVIADVQAFEGQPIDEVRPDLRAALNNARQFAVNLLDAKSAVNSEYRRAITEVGQALRGDRTRPVIVIGYSWGTVLERQFLSVLERSGRNVQAVVIIDAVHLVNPRAPKGLLQLNNLDHKRLSVPAAYKGRTYVYRQTEDTLKGTEVHASDGSTIPSVNVCTVDPAACSHGAIRTADAVVNDILAKLGHPTTSTSSSTTSTSTTSTTSTTLPCDPYADAVAAYAPGRDLLGGVYDVPAEALGAPQMDEFSGFVSLGQGGSLTLQFTDNVIVDGPGADFLLYEAPNKAEGATIEVSDNGTNFVSLGLHTVGIGTPFDLAGSGFATVRFIRIIDDAIDTSPPSAGTTYSGYDADAAEALNSACPP